MRRVLDFGWDCFVVWGKWLKRYRSGVGWLGGESGWDSGGRMGCFLGGSGWRRAF